MDQDDSNKTLLAVGNSQAELLKAMEEARNAPPTPEAAPDAPLPPPASPPKKMNPWIIAVVVVIVLCCCCVGAIGLLFTFGQPILDQLGIQTLAAVRF